MAEWRVRCSEQECERARERRRHPTPEEAALWQALRSRQIRGVKFRRQKVLCGGSVDFWCPSLFMVVDIDGREKEEEVECDARLAAKGIVVLRFAPHHIHDDVHRVVETITCVVAARQSALSRLRPVVALDAATGEQGLSFKPALRAMSPREARLLMMARPHPLLVGPVFGRQW